MQNFIEKPFKKRTLTIIHPFQKPRKYHEIIRVSDSRVIQKWSENSK